MLRSLKFLVYDRPPVHSFKKYFLTHWHKFRAEDAKDHSEKPLVFPWEETDSEREGGMTSPLSNSVRAGHFSYTGLWNTTIIEDCNDNCNEDCNEDCRGWAGRGLVMFQSLNTILNTYDIF